MRVCKVEDCEGIHEARGWCNKHYLRFKYHGEIDLLRPRYPKAEDALVARSVWEGDCLVWTGAKSGDGYGRLKHNGHSMGAHHVAWELTNGAVPEGLELDHLCGNRACVNTNHLEPVTHAENMKRRGIRKVIAPALRGGGQ